MQESFLHYIWQFKLFTASSLRTTDGDEIEIINVGQYNTNAGPDFFNAKIRIASTMWAGNIEIHTNASDWIKHQHQFNKSYDNVILHVVQNADTDVYRTDGQKIPQLILTYPSHLEENYTWLQQNQKWIACADKIHAVPSIVIQSWKNTLLAERLESKMETIQHLLNESEQHWEEAFYITLARNFGFGVNNQAFEQLAKSLPLSVIGKHKDQLLQLEALLLGQAGFLAEQLEDNYYKQLKLEYHFLKQKYQLSAMDVSQWKLLRLRPDNFPPVRIAQFAALIHRSSKLFSKILERPTMDYLCTLFATEPSEYWQTHYLLGQESASVSKKLGVASIHGLLINTVVPFLFCHAHSKQQQELKDNAMQLLESIPAEKNSIVRHWQELGLHSASAYDTQALIQLKNNYCNFKKCLHCRVGHKVMAINN